MPCTTHLTTLTFQIKQAITLQADIAPRVLHNCAFIGNVGNAGNDGNAGNTGDAGNVAQ